MFPAFIDVTTDDRRGVVDLVAGEHVNPAADIVFEPHVWAECSSRESLSVLALLSAHAPQSRAMCREKPLLPARPLFRCDRMSVGREKGGKPDRCRVDLPMGS
jgi:hypothetical protein